MRLKAGGKLPGFKSEKKNNPSMTDKNIFNAIMEIMNQAYGHTAGQGFHVNIFCPPGIITV